MLIIAELQIMLHWPTRIPRFLILARGNSGGDGPEGDEDRDEGQRGEKEQCVKAAAEFEGQVTGDGGAKDEEEDVREGLATGGVGGERAVLDGGVLEEDIQFDRQELCQLGQFWPFNGIFLTYGCGADAIVFMRRRGCGRGGCFDVFKVV